MRTAVLSKAPCTLQSMSCQCPSGQPRSRGWIASKRSRDGSNESQRRSGAGSSSGSPRTTQAPPAPIRSGYMCLVTLRSRLSQPSQRRNSIRACPCDMSSRVTTKQQTRISSTTTTDRSRAARETRRASLALAGAPRLCRTPRTPERSCCSRSEPPRLAANSSPGCRRHWKKTMTSRRGSDRSSLVLYSSASPVREALRHSRRSRHMSRVTARAISQRRNFRRAGQRGTRQGSRYAMKPFDVAVRTVSRRTFGCCSATDVSTPSISPLSPRSKRAA